ncbi:MAG: hypothetical protein KJ710_00010 [Candidatus Omnitrophica bacterium]|nr:hypothetical protein [Candidatus Omnitrophota bacterium]
MRQYRYKINSHIGHDVINYQNGIYSLVGYIKESEIIEGNDRNTDLLQSDNVKSEQVKTNMDKSPEKKPKINIIPAIIAVIVLLLSFIDWSSYGYYTFLKFLVTGVAIYYAYFIYTKLILKGFWFWSLVGIAVLFNPIVPIYLYEKGVWMIIDIMVIIYLIVLVFKFRK